MVTRKLIDDFLGSDKIAVAGISRNEKKFGSMLAKELHEHGKNIVGVTPHMEEFKGINCYKSIADLPSDVNALIIVVKPENTLKLVEEADKKGINKIWMQQGSQSSESIAYCQEKGMNLVVKECVFMYFEPVQSIHKFHRGIKKLFGGYHRV